MKYRSAHSPIWANEEKSQVNLVVHFTHLDQEVPFTACQNDIEAHGRELFELAKAEKFGKVGDYIDTRNYYAEWKLARKAIVNKIAVEVDGLVFDGDEESQNRMARVVAAADDLGQQVAWTLTDNSTVQVAVEQLKRALQLATAEQTRIWNEGRDEL